MEPSEYPTGGNSPGQPNLDLPLQICPPPRSSPLSVQKVTNKIQKRRARRSVPVDFYTRLLTESPLRREFKLRFINSPSPVIFTYLKIEAEDGSSLAVELVDAATESRVTSGPLSSSRLEIVAVAANFTNTSWTVAEFEQRLEMLPEGKRPFIAGDLIVTLKDGFGVIENVVFTNDSGRCSGKKFRLGARAIGGGVMGAISTGFECIDPLTDRITFTARNHFYPSPGSEISRLEGIPENGFEASRLAKEGIRTVQELRRCIATNPDALQRILGRFVSKYTLATIVSHAMRCEFDDTECYAYNVQATEGFLLFNSAYELIKVSFDGARSLNYDQFTTEQKELIDHLKLEAYENVDRFAAVDISSFEDYQQGRDSLANLSKPYGKSEVLPPDPSRVSSHIYDVVIRYREGDVSHGFISHLYDALCQKGISVAEDFVEASIHVQPVNAVPECRVLIIFLTSCGVSSNLLQILQYNLKKDLGFSQISYRLSPSDSIGNKKKLERFYHHDQRKIWDVLKEAVPENILTDKSESELMHEIVRDVSNVLSNDKEKMIGMDTRVEEVLSLLCIDSAEVRCIGIWGTSGIGKTAIAEKIFRRISVQYMTCVFMKDLHEEVEKQGQVTVRERFLSKILEVEPSLLRISDLNTNFLRSKLQCKRVLVIFDDVNDFRDAETFFGYPNYFGPGSRIIITSRNRRVFAQSKIDHIYEVKPLDISTSLLLLDVGTFGGVKSMPIADLRKQSLELVKFANGNPEVLQYMNINIEWNLLSQEILHTPPICIPRLLRSCYGLDENEMNIFLDIACFFNRMDKDNVAMLLDGCDFFAHVGFRSLVDKSLLNTSHNLVNMHRFIQATGREIVRQESTNWPGKRSRLWNRKDIVDVFLDDSGTSAIEGIFLDMSNKDFDADPNIFEKMRNLRLLKFYCSEVRKNRGFSLPQGLEYLPSKLRLLHWESYPLSSLPRSFDPKNLVELNLPSSCAKKLWKGKKSLEKLKKMRLSYSYQLTKIPKLSRAPNLELLDLEGCSNLLSISQSISYLKKLVFLNLKDCSNLESVPSTVDLESLKVLNLSGCSKLEIFPVISPNVKELYIGGTMIQEIPPSIKNLVLLENLDLENSSHLVNLPTSICKLKHLETLNLSGCSSLERFPDLSRKMKCLKSLDLSRTAIKELPSSISYLTALEELRFVDCKSLVRLPDNVWSLRFKIEFRQIDTGKFSRLWDRFEWLNPRGSIATLSVDKEYWDNLGFNLKQKNNN